MKRDFKLVLSRIKSYIDDVDVVSFDVFDTLLIRPYMLPKDLFAHIERVNQKPGFYKARVTAEQNARKKDPQKEDITFSEIYAEIDEEFECMARPERFELSVF